MKKEYPEFPYKNVIIVDANWNEDSDDCDYFQWLIKNVGPEMRSTNGSPVYLLTYTYSGNTLHAYAAGKGWCATFANPGKFRSLGEDVDIIGIEDDALALQFSLMFS